MEPKWLILKAICINSVYLTHTKHMEYLISVELGISYAKVAFHFFTASQLEKKSKCEFKKNIT